MPAKKELMTIDVNAFIAAMNPKKECKRKGASTARNVKGRHKTSKS